MLNVFILSVIMLRVSMRSVTMLNVIMQSVVGYSMWVVVLQSYSKYKASRKMAASNKRSSLFVKSVSKNGGSYNKKFTAVIHFVP